MQKEDGNRKKTLLLEAGRELFWKYGFRRVTTDEICRKAGVSRMTFYRFFGNKTELAMTIYSNLADEGIRKFHDILNADDSSSEKLKKILMLKLKETNNISREFLMDFYNSPGSDLQIFVEETNRKIWNEVIDGFRYAQEKGWFRKSMKPEFLLAISQNLGTLITDEQLLKLYDSPQDLVMEYINLIMYGIAPVK